MGGGAASRVLARAWYNSPLDLPIASGSVLSAEPKAVVLPQLSVSWDPPQRMEMGSVRLESLVGCRFAYSALVPSSHRNHPLHKQAEVTS